jgi:hypothetical protein
MAGSKHIIYFAFSIYLFVLVFKYWYVIIEINHRII